MSSHEVLALEVVWFLRYKLLKFHKLMGFCFDLLTVSSIRFGFEKWHIDFPKVPEMYFSLICLIELIWLIMIMQ